MQLEVNGFYIGVEYERGDGIKAPVTLNVCLSESSEAKSSDLECYYYTVLNKRDGKILGIPLRDTQLDWVRDFARLCATMVTKQAQKPCYVAVSFNGNANAFQFDTPQILKAIKDTTSSN